VLLRVLEPKKSFFGIETHGFKFYFFIFYFLFIQGTVFSQQWLKNGVLDTISLDLKLNGNRPHQDEINKKLGAIAYSHQKPVETLRIQWQLIASYQVFRMDKGNFKSEILIKPMSPEGDLNLYNFNSSAYILPKIKSFRLRIFKKDSSLVYLKYFNKPSISVASVGEIVHFPIWHQRWSKDWFMKIDQFNYVYNYREISFEQWFQYTNDYKATDYIVGQMLQDYQSLQQNPQKADAFLLKSLRLAHYLKKLYQSPFYKYSIQKKVDPDNLAKKMNVFSTLLDLNIKKYSRQLSLQNTSSQIDIKDIVRAYLLEEASVLQLREQYSSIYDAVFDVLSQSDYPANLKYNALDYFNLIAKNKKDRVKIQTAFEKLLYQKSIFNIDEQLRNKKFSEALFTINNLEGFVNNVDALKLNSTFNQFKARAAYGIYHSYLDVASKAIKIKNTALAFQYLKKASQLQKKYPQQIITDGLVKKQARRLVTICSANYQAEIQKEDYAAAAEQRDRLYNLIQDFELKDAQNIMEQIKALDSQALNK
jgi:hypothetical protein